MKRLVMLLVAGIAFLGSFIASQGAEAGGGGGNYACQNDKKVTDTYDGPALEVTVRDSCFGPVLARITPGTELRWVNRGQIPHNIVEASGLKQAQDLQPGGTVTMNFAQAGAFVYYCAFHPGMTGAVFVGDSLADASPELVKAAPSASKTQPPSATAPSVANVQLPAQGGDGVSTLTVALLALAVGTIAGGGSTLLVRLLDRKPGM
jgi:plastocyanin